MSHSSVDKALVAELARALRSRGLEPWLDVEQLVPGVPFQSELAAGVATSRCFAVFIGTEEVGSWVWEELDIAVARAATDRAFRVFLVLLPTAPADFDPSGLHPFLSQRSWVDLRAVDDTDAAGRLLARAVRGEPLGLVGRGVPDDALVDGRSVCPYVGLRPFDIEDAAWFFGRAADTQRMAEKLRRSSFLAVVGASGSGKSSAVLAGLVPALQAGGLVEGSERWTIRVLHPTADPLEELAAHVSALRPDVAASRIVDELAANDAALKVLTTARDGPEQVVWVVDQAEELFTLCSDAEQRRAFVANLLHVSQVGGPARVVVALRSDFYGRLGELEALSARVASNQHVITDLGDDQLMEVVAQPAALAGLTLQPGLAERIVADVWRESATLPLLQHALRELWVLRRGRDLTHDGYRRLGGVAGALANRADEVLAEIEEAGDGPVVRHLMLALTRLGEGSADTKQPAVLGELASPAYPIERLHKVATALADARLVTTAHIADRGGATDGPGETGPGADTRVEMAHEALIWSWPTLRSWIEDSREELRGRRRVQHAARGWQEQGRPHELLYRGTALAVAHEQFHDRRERTPALESEFLTASIDHERRELARYRRTRRIALLGAFLTLAVVAAVTVGLFLDARRARQDAQDSVARALARQAEALAPHDPALALALGAEAHARLPSPETATVLQTVYLTFSQAPRHLDRTLTHGGPHPVHGLAVDAEGAHLATGGRDGTARLWEVATGDEIATLTGHTGPVNGVAFSPDGSLVATAGRDGVVRLWEVASGEEVAGPGGHGGPVYGVAFSPDGDLVATAGRDGVVRLWEVASGEEAAALVGHGGPVYGVAFSPDGDLVATAGRDRTARLWDPVTGEEVATLTGHTGPVNGVAFSGDGELVATAGAAGTEGAAKLWNPATGGEVATLTGHAGSVNEVAFSPDGGLVATAGSDGTARLWNPTMGDEVATLRHPDTVTQVVFSPDGGLVATAGSDGSARVWKATTGDDVVPLGHDAPVSGAAFSPDGDLVATAGEDGTARLWDAASGQRVAALTGHAGSVNGVAFDPDGDLVATAGSDGTARLWDVATGGEVTVLTGHTASVNAVAFSGDGGLVATASRDGTARLWDPATGDGLHTLTGHDTTVHAVDFDPGGTLVATAAADGSARLWDVSTGQVVTRLHHDRRVSATRVLGVDFDGEGALVATASGDGTARLWDRATGRAAGTLTGHTDSVNAVAFDPGGPLVGTAGGDGTVRLWDPATSEEVASLTGHDGEIRALAVDPDGGRFATVGDDRTVLVRRVMVTAPEACQLAAAEVTSADLTAALGDVDPQACTGLDGGAPPRG